MNRSFASSFVVLTFALAGCGSSSSTSASDPDAVNDGTDVSSTESHVESLGTSFAGGGGTGTGELSLATYGDLTGGDLATQDIGDAAKSFYSPSGCLVVTNDTSTSTVTYAFTNCTGPYGLVKVNGTVTVGYVAPSASELKLTFKSTNLQLNNATVASWTGTADITANGTARSMVWAGMYTGTTARGVSFTHASDRTITWTTGTDCLGETGTSDGQIGSLNVKVDVTNFQVCKGSCPAAGSAVTVTDETDSATYNLTYGDDTATYINAAGRSFTYKPLCTSERAAASGTGR